MTQNNQNRPYEIILNFADIAGNNASPSPRIIIQLGDKVVAQIPTVGTSPLKPTAVGYALSSRIAQYVRQDAKHQTSNNRPESSAPKEETLTPETQPKTNAAEAVSDLIDEVVERMTICEGDQLTSGVKQSLKELFPLAMFSHINCVGYAPACGAIVEDGVKQALRDAMLSRSGCVEVTEARELPNGRGWYAIGWREVEPAERAENVQPLGLDLHQPDEPRWKQYLIKGSPSKALNAVFRWYNNGLRVNELNELDATQIKYISSLFPGKPMPERVYYSLDTREDIRRYGLTPLERHLIMESTLARAGVAWYHAVRLLNGPNEGIIAIAGFDPTKDDTPRDCAPGDCASTSSTRESKSAITNIAENCRVTDEFAAKLHEWNQNGVTFYLWDAAPESVRDHVKQDGALPVGEPFCVLVYDPLSLSAVGSWLYYLSKFDGVTRRLPKLVQREFRVTLDGRKNRVIESSTRKFAAIFYAAETIDTPETDGPTSSTRNTPTIKFEKLEEALPWVAESKLDAVEISKPSDETSCDAETKSSARDDAPQAAAPARYDYAKDIISVRWKKCPEQLRDMALRFYPELERDAPWAVMHLPRATPPEFQGRASDFLNRMEQRKGVKIDPLRTMRIETNVGVTYLFFKAKDQLSKQERRARKRKSTADMVQIKLLTYPELTLEQRILLHTAFPKLDVDKRPDVIVFAPMIERLDAFEAMHNRIERLVREAGCVPYVKPLADGGCIVIGHKIKSSKSSDETPSGTPVSDIRAFEDELRKIAFHTVRTTNASNSKRVAGGHWHVTPWHRLHLSTRDDIEEYFGANKLNPAPDVVYSWHRTSGGVIPQSDVIKSVLAVVVENEPHAANISVLSWYGKKTGQASVVRACVWNETV